MGEHCEACSGSILVPIHKVFEAGEFVGQDWKPCPGLDVPKLRVLPPRVPHIPDQCDHTMREREFATVDKLGCPACAVAELARLYAVTDMVVRIADGESDDTLAADYGGTGWENDPAVRAMYDLRGRGGAAPGRECRGGREEMSERVTKDRAYYKEYNRSHLDTRPDIDIQWYFDRVEELERDLAAAQARIELLDRLATAHQRGKHEAEKRIAVLTEAVTESNLALDDWINTYAQDECDPGRVAEAKTRIRQGGGTLAYIAKLRQKNKTALTAPNAAVDEKRKTPC